MNMRNVKNQNNVTPLRLSGVPSNENKLVDVPSKNIKQ